MARQRRQAWYFDAVVGRRVSQETALDRAAEYDALAAQYAKEAERAYATFLQRVRPSARARWESEYEVLAAEADRYRGAAARLVDELTHLAPREQRELFEAIKQEEIDEGARVREAEREAADRLRRLEEEEILRDEREQRQGLRAHEWELGLDYVAGVTTSNVTVNVRFRREGGKRMTKDEAEAAIGVWVRTGEAPPGVEVIGLGWSRRLGADFGDSREGDPEYDREPLKGPMIEALSRGDYRLGAVADD